MKNNNKLFKLSKNGFLAFYFAVFLVGCSNKINPSFVAERWANTMSGFNIDPVFPPRYIQPGDIFLVFVPTKDPNKDKNRYKRRSLRIGRVDVSEALDKDAKLSLQLPKTDEKELNTNIFSKPEKVVKLHPVGFIGFNIADAEQIDLSVFYPFHVLKALLGFSGMHDLVMSISVPNAEDIELPAIEAYAALKTFCSISPNKEFCDTTSKDKSKQDILVNELKQNFLLPDDNPEDMQAEIVIVTHAYYARQIDYSYTTEGGAAMLADVTTVIDSATTTGDSTPTGNSATSPLPGNAPTNSNIDTRLQDIEKKLQSLKTNTTEPNGKLQVLAANSKGAVLRQTFDTPVVIGYRGLNLGGSSQPSINTR